MFTDDAHHRFGAALGQLLLWCELPQYVGEGLAQFVLAHELPLRQHELAPFVFVPLVLEVLEGFAEVDHAPLKVLRGQGLAPPAFHQSPDTFDRVELGRVGGQVVKNVVLFAEPTDDVLRVVRPVVVKYQHGGARVLAERVHPLLEKDEEVLLVGAGPKVETQVPSMSKEGAVDGGALAAVAGPVHREWIPLVLPHPTALIPKIGCRLVNPDDLMTAPMILRELMAPLSLFLKEIGPLLGPQELQLRLGPGDPVTPVPPP